MGNLIFDKGELQMKMSITQALSELKLLDSRISKGINGSGFCAPCMNGTKINGTTTPEEAEKAFKNNWQSATDLIKRRANMKSAIVKSNAETEVEIGGGKMTVAEAIERKSSIKYDQLLLAKLKEDFRRATATVVQGNEQARAKAQQSLDTVLGKDNTKTPSKEELAAIFDPVFARYEYKMVDPLGIEKKIEELEENIESFLNNVDFILSTSNAITQIEID